MASITSLGVGSGLDIGGLVNQLVAAERAPVQTRLDTREAEALGKLSALGAVKGAVSGFQSSLATLQDLATFQGRSVTSSNEELFTATASASAIAGRYAVEVESLASNHKLRSDAYTDAATAVGDGTLTITSGSETFTVTIDPSANTLADIVSGINEATGNTQVLATVVNSTEGSHLVLTAAESGAASAITVAAADGDGGLDALVYDADPGNPNTQLNEVTEAADGVLRVDGLQVNATNNVVTDAIEGVTINLVGADVGNIFDLKIDYDTSGARDKLTGFVSAYNNLLAAFASQTSFDAETLVAGPLFGESALRDLRSDIRSAVGGFLETDSELYNSLTQIGINTNLDGTLSIDAATMDLAFAENFDEVGRLFAGDNGFATQLDNVVGQYLEPTGGLETRTDLLKLLIDDITEQREALELRMVSVEERLRAQFSALDSLVGQLNNTSSFLTQQLANLPGSNTNTR